LGKKPNELKKIGEAERVADSEAEHYNLPKAD
jgi:hypothetical protein